MIGKSARDEEQAGALVEVYDEDGSVLLRHGGVEMGQNVIRERILAWTTTPWTLPANVAAPVKPDAEYVWVEYEGERCVVAKDRCEAVFGAGARIVGIVDEVEINE